MRSSIRRLSVILALLVCAVIIGTQVSRLRRALEIREQAFQLQVSSAMRQAAMKVIRNESIPAPIDIPVTLFSKDCFLVPTNVFLKQDLLQQDLVQAFTQQQVLSDFEFGLSGGTGGTLQYRGYHHMPGLAEHRGLMASAFPRLKNGTYFLAVYFPHRRQFLMAQLPVRTIASFVLLCFTGFLGCLLLIVFGQQRKSGTSTDFVRNLVSWFNASLPYIRLTVNGLRNPQRYLQPQLLLNDAGMCFGYTALQIVPVQEQPQSAEEEPEGPELRKTPFVWQELLQEVAAEEQLRTGAGKSIIELYLPEQAIHFFGDVRCLKQAIRHIIGHALKHCGNRPVIRISLTDSAPGVRISMEDNGIGMDRHQLKMLFREKGPGLNNTRLIIRAHGGSIECESQIAKGSIFTLTFPHYKNVNHHG